MTAYDVVVIGGGPGGYVAAVRSAQLGFKTAVVEKEAVGGVCVNWGCIPTKALLRNAEVIHTLGQGKAFGFSAGDVNVDYEAAYKRSRQVAKRQGRRVESLLKNHQVDVIGGTARFEDADTVSVEPDGGRISARYFIIATGAKSRRVPGVDFDGRRVITYRRALEMTQAPESVVVIGAGPIGMEFATIWNRYGARVTVVEMMPRALPLEDDEIGPEVERQFKRAKIPVKTGAKVSGVDVGDDGVRVTVSQERGDEEIEAQVVLAAIGFVPNSDDLGLDRAGVAVDERGAITIDDAMRTSAENIFAIGDVTAKLGLAHTASAQGVVAAEAMAGRSTLPLSYHNIPRCTYSWPETASVGLTEAQAKEAGYDVRAVVSPFAPNGKAVAMNENVGFVKLVAESKDDRVLGVHMVGPHVTELIAGPTGLIALGATVDQMAAAVYPHPTLSEAVMEGAHALAGHAIHI
jgi:dihydrolipoamide dehydrogenase